MKRLFTTASGEQVQVAARSGDGGFAVQIALPAREINTNAGFAYAPDGTLLVTIDGIVRPARVTIAGENAWLHTAAGTAIVERVQPRRRGGGGEAGSAVVAPMTGRIVVVDVAVGDTVSKGQQTVVIEAMKMEQPLLAPRDGVVLKVSCEVGQLVDGGTILVALEPQEPASADASEPG